jgi:hypothetical protein
MGGGVVVCYIPLNSYGDGYLGTLPSMLSKQLNIQWGGFFRHGAHCDPLKIPQIAN